ncbi:hypothetical protein Tco_0019627 [Tanacetum coccineum]
MGKNFTLSVNVLSPRRTRRMLAELGVKSKDGDKPQKDATCLMEIDSQEVHPKPSIYNNDIDIIKLENENEELLRFLALEGLLEEIHMTWAHLEKKRTRLWTYTKSHDDFCK